MLADNPIYNRSYTFARDVIRVARVVDQNVVTRSLIGQLVRSSTSIGANISEATFGASRKDFINKITIALKESQESLYWLGLLTDAGYIKLSDAENLRAEAVAINKILSTIKIKSASKMPT